MVATAVSGSNTNASSYTNGQCTWGVASLLGWVPAGLGNADTWFANAVKKGLSTSMSPSVGDVVVYQGGTSPATAYSPAAEYSSSGHVAVVTALGPGQTFSVREMNYSADGGGPGIYDTRVSSLVNVQGFIEPPGMPAGAAGSGAGSATGSLSNVSTDCAWNVPLLGCILSQSAVQKLEGGLIMFGGGIILMLGVGLVVIGALAETKAGRTVEKVAGAAGVGKVIATAAAPARVVQGQRQRRTQRQAATVQTQRQEQSRNEAEAHQRATRRAQLRVQRARARQAEGRAKSTTPPRTRVVYRQNARGGGGHPASYRDANRPIENKAKYDAVFGD